MPGQSSLRCHIELRKALPDWILHDGVTSGRGSLSQCLGDMQAQWTSAYVSDATAKAKAAFLTRLLVQADEVVLHANITHLA